MPLNVGGEHPENCKCNDCSKTYPPTTGLCGICGKPVDNHDWVVNGVIGNTPKCP